ncbi:DHS-like NAD/FAD-binding domain-containing protein [Gymnopilus junonius]|uniref:DHS-like NAD/FAD-binding domain-containing protein n=1 Tax=Gymnopilus junonius TaxID=109634 RepID=A0A9P5NIM3_GYMJU|nr:DHS-like NAD/FAD-binding domain-containing protein [Gymnopilus junonius]
MNFGSNRRGGQGKKPKVLSGKDIPSLVKYMKSKDCKNVFLMLGAGVSTSAGIPDFRSPETGLYSNLARLNLPHPEAVFEINFFRRNPVPFYTLAHELYPGKFRPTITHSFIRLLSEKSLLHTCFTQNIDTLERRAGVPDDKIIEAHGSFATQRCVDCGEPYDDEKMKEHILEKKIAKCPECGGYVKPDIVFFGEGLPPQFIQSLPNLRKADLLIVMGTSLTVQPFASLAGMVDTTCPRVLINLDRVGDFGSRSDDVVLLGKCDDIVRDLCKELGWEEELNELWETTKETVITEKPGKKEEVPDVLQEMEEQFEHLAVQEDVAEDSTKTAEEASKEDKNADAKETTAKPSPAADASKKDKKADVQEAIDNEQPATKISDSLSITSGTDETAKAKTTGSSPSAKPQDAAEKQTDENDETQRDEYASPLSKPQGAPEKQADEKDKEKLTESASPLVKPGEKQPEKAPSTEGKL